MTLQARPCVQCSHTPTLNPSQSVPLLQRLQPPHCMQPPALLRPPSHLGQRLAVAVEAAVVLLGLVLEHHDLRRI